jgi:hypothetical protein
MARAGARSGQGSAGIRVAASTPRPAAREGARSYDAPGAQYTHRDGECSFDVLIEDFHLAGDPALVRLAGIAHAADIAQDRDNSPEGPGLYAIAHGFALLHGTQDPCQPSRARTR